MLWSIASLFFSSSSSPFNQLLSRDFIFFLRFHLLLSTQIDIDDNLNLLWIDVIKTDIMYACMYDFLIIRHLISSLCLMFVCLFVLFLDVKSMTMLIESHWDVESSSWSKSWKIGKLDYRTMSNAAAEREREREFCCKAERGNWGKFLSLF